MEVNIESHLASFSTKKAKKISGDGTDGHSIDNQMFTKGMHFDHSMSKSGISWVYFI